MSKEKLSSHEIVELLSTKAGISRKQADDFLKFLFSTIEDALLAGESVKIKGFGTFKLQWNEPRKSVNVQTGEEIILAGYYKVTFSPETQLKEAVNEPFAHLEPVVLDQNNDPVAEKEPSESVFDQMGIFTEQANEIKDILSEIQSLSATNSSETDIQEEIIEVDESQIDDFKLDEKEIEEEEEEEVSVDEKLETEENEKEIDIEEQIEKEEIVEATSVIVELKPEKIAEPEKTEESLVTETLPPIEEPVLEQTAVEEAPTVEPVKDQTEFTPIKKKKRKAGWLIFMLVLIVLVAGGTIGTYYSSSCVKCWFEYEFLSEANRQKLQKFNASLQDFFATQHNDVVTLPVTQDSVQTQDTLIVETDTLTQVTPIISQAIDTLHIMLNSTRKYTEYLGSERIVEGSSLTRFALRYYGNKKFWVYIYEANRERIQHPDRIPIGTLIKVPKVDSRLIDDENKIVMDKVQELHDLYVGK